MILLSLKLLVAQALIALSSCNTTPPVVETQPQRQAEVEAETDPVIELLDKLEKSTIELRDFQAKIRYSTWDAALEQLQLRTGELIYQVKPEDSSKRFAILFDTLIVGTRKQDHNKHYIFADSWLVEIDHESKHFLKRQIVAPGKKFDPLKLGEGPFPLPLGQSKDEVLARFNVKLLEKPSDEFLAGKLAGLDVKGMVLFPKPNTPEAEKFSKVELFYDSKMLLPIAINAVAAELVDPDDPNSRNRKTVWLRDVKRNQGIDESKLSIAEPDKTQWTIDVRQWVGD